jgi:plasmid maintenance system antidote protein VapI
MLLFSDLQARLVAAVQAQVQGGSLTERGLARGCGVSQPHIHHILAGKRVLTIPVADRILDYLRISAADLLREERILVR